MKCMKREQQPDRPNEATRQIPCCQTPLPLASKPASQALPHSGDALVPVSSYHRTFATADETYLLTCLESHPSNCLLMQKFAHFRVDPKLAHVLGESYTSSEKALKELIDNAWDAEATEVHVTAPNILTDSPIIAIPRFSRKGDHAAGDRGEDLRRAKNQMEQTAPHAVKPTRVAPWPPLTSSRSVPRF